MLPLALVHQLLTKCLIAAKRPRSPVQSRKQWQRFIPMRSLLQPSHPPLMNNFSSQKLPKPSCRKLSQARKEPRRAPILWYSPSHRPESFGRHQAHPRSSRAPRTPRTAVDRFCTTPFNREQYLADPNAYLQLAEPGRCYDAAQPGGRHPGAQTRVRSYLPNRPGEQVALSVLTEPGMPASFTTFDNGRFAETELTTATVRADERGVATVHYKATAGVTADVSIRAASPVASSTLFFRILITSATTSAIKQPQVSRNP